MKADLRSDTITLPTEGMRAAICAAVAGDDCYGDDPSVNCLQEKCAALLGKEAALFTCSGTMSNQLALRAHTQPGDEIILEQNYHINFFESAPTAQLAQLAINALATSDGILTPALIDRALSCKPRSPVYAVPRLICLENTIAFYGGRVFPLAQMRDIRAYADEKQLRIHLDGARLLNACAASNHDPAEYAALADTVSLCFAKGLGAPFGSILSGDRAVIDRAKIFRKWYGGGLHQAGFMAAAALYALDNHMPHLAQDHEKAQLLYDLLSQGEGIKMVGAPETNIVIFDISGTDLCAAKFVEIMERDHNVRLFPWLGTQVRAITHRDVSCPQISWAADRIRAVARRHARSALHGCATRWSDRNQGAALIS